jgi:hypothetical protein
MTMPSAAAVRRIIVRNSPGLTRIGRGILDAPSCGKAAPRRTCI